MATTTHAQVSCCSPPVCTCPRCTGLECLERPRFFAGQLLTENELNGLDSYIRAKHRLHNLHHHGWGVVCGLEVVCHECDGWVTVRSGYAIDPCGNDIVVCQDHAVNVAEQIRLCRQAERRHDCRPLAPPPPTSPPPTSPPPGTGVPPGTSLPPCDPPEYWYITLHYAEHESRPTTALRRQPCDRPGCGPGCSCGGGKKNGGCGCGGGGHGECSCGCGGKRPAEARHGVGSTIGPCEPTRILESYRLELCQLPEDFCDDLQSEAEKAWIERLQECVTRLQRDVRGVPAEDLNLLGALLGGPASPPGDFTAFDIRDACRRVRCFLLEPGAQARTQCADRVRIEALDCPDPLPTDTPTTYWARVQPTVAELVGHLERRLLECLCVAWLPPCAPCCPGDDLLILARLTVRNGRIERICNTSCRRYAGVFPPSIGGVYLGPLLALLMRQLDGLCCGGEAVSLTAAFGAQAGDAFRDAASFTSPASFLSRSLSVPVADLAGVEVADRSLRLSGLVGGTLEQAEAAAGEAGVNLTAREVDSLPRASLFTAPPAVASGGRVVAFVRDGTVLGFARRDSPEEAMVEQGAQLTALRQELDTLRLEIRGGSAAGPDVEDTP